MNNAYLTFIHALAPLHAGTGQGVGVIDLPIAREKATNLPFLPGSTLKGTLRDACAEGEDARDQIFGKGGDVDGKSGSAIFSDQKLLCLPVRSLFGTFAWVTSPFILERFKRDLALTEDVFHNSVPRPAGIESCLVADASLTATVDNRTYVILEDLDLNSVQSPEAVEWADRLGAMIFANSPASDDWKTIFNRHFCIVSDDVMNFLAETATEVTARNVLNDNKTSNNLWYEESLPAESILSGVLANVGNRQDIIDSVRKICEKPIQLGGNMTVGRGLCRVVVHGGGGNR